MSFNPPYEINTPHHEIQGSLGQWPAPSLIAQSAHDYNKALPDVTRGLVYNPYEYQQAAQDAAMRKLERIEAYQAHRLSGLPTDSAERKETPVFSGVLKYFPDAIADVARLSKIGNDKHNAGQPLHWSREKSNDHGDCIVRHQMEAGVVDTDSVLHDTKVAWRALAQLQLAIEALRAKGVQYP